MTSVDKRHPKAQANVIPPATATVLIARGLTKSYGNTKSSFGRTRKAPLAVDDVSFELRGGQTLGIVGESGCGKTTTARMVAGLEIPTAGELLLDGVRLQPLPRIAIRRPAPRDVQMVFQDPYASLDPRTSVLDSVCEPMRFGSGSRTGKAHAIDRGRELLQLVGIPESSWNSRPRVLSGGQRQRVGIARALMTDPKVLVADEPTSALDVSVRAQVLNLLVDVQRETGVAMLIISHDLATIRSTCDHVVVMYLGRVVERGSLDEVFDAPRHPYTCALLSAAPVADPVVMRDRWREVLPGEVPSLRNPPPGCHFNPRCPKATEVCRGESPPLENIDASGHLVACYHPN